MSLLSGFVGTANRGLRGQRAPGMFDALEARQLLTGAPFAAGHTIVDLKTTYGDVWIELFDQETPLTVANFMNYVNNNRYDGTFIHRYSDQGDVNKTPFVLQMGGYKYDGATSYTQWHIPTFSPVQNEFSATRSNLVRTVAMAKLGGDPNSATSEFFFNLSNNSSILDGQNGGFTVFGQVVNGWDVVLKISRLQIVNATPGTQTAFNTVPVRENFDGTNITDQSLVIISDVVTITGITWDQHGNGGRNVVGAATLGGQTLFSTVSPQGHAIAFYQSSATSTWQVSDISLQTGTSAIAGQVVAWADPKDSRFYVAAPTAAGLLLFTRDSDGFWKARNLNGEVPTADIFPVSASLTVFISIGDATSGDIVNIAGLNPQGQIVLFTQSSKTASGGNYPWTFTNLHTRDLVPAGLATPAFVGSLTSYVTSWNGQNIAGLDAAGHVQAVWWAPGMTAWTVNDLNAITLGPALTGGLTPYLTPWGGINLAGTDSNGKVSVTWWGGGATEPWHTNNLTDEFGGASPLPLVIGSLTSYVTPWGGLNVTGTTADGRIVVYWWGGPGDNTLPIWKVTVLTDGVAGATNVSGRILGTASPTGQINLTGLSANGNVLRYNWKPGEAVWNMQDLTALATFW